MCCFLSELFFLLFRYPFAALTTLPVVVYLTLVYLYIFIYIVMCSSTIIEHKNESVAKQLVCCSRFEFCQSI